MAAELHIVAIGCHECDAEEMAGPVPAKYARRGHLATIVALTRGERGHPTKLPEVYGPQLEREMKEAAAILGVDTMWMGFSSGDITVSDHVMAAIAELLRRLRADKGPGRAGGTGIAAISVVLPHHGHRAGARGWFSLRQGLHQIQGMQGTSLT